MLNDLLSDTLTRIRNAILANYKSVRVKKTKAISAFLSVLQEEGFIESFNQVESLSNPAFSEYEVHLKYINGSSFITQLERVSKPGRRIYAGKDNIPKVYNGLGIAVLSTSSGVISDRKARDLGVGGEVWAYVY